MTTIFRRPISRRFTWPDAIVSYGYLAAAVIVFAELWVNLDRGYLVNGGQDQNMWEWFFAVTARNITHLQNPLFSDLQNFPLGVNLMSNTTMLGIGIPLLPITFLFGPTVTFALVLTGGLAATAAAWYWVFSRYVVESRLGAVIGGALCGFAPAIISHANAHPNFVALFLLPFITIRLLKSAEATRPWRDGIILGLLITWQLFLGEEPLLIAFIAITVFVASYVISRPRSGSKKIRRALPTLGIAAGLSIMVAAFPLWWQFFGPQSYRTIEHGAVGNDLAAIVGFSSESLAGDVDRARELSLNPTEENAFLGWPLVVLTLVLMVVLWRNVIARSLSITILALTALSLGPKLTLSGEETGIYGPWKLLADLPLFDSLLESRLAIGCLPAIGALLAIATHKLWGAARTWRGGKWMTPVRCSWLVLVVAVLLPIVPTQLEASDRDPVPAFFTGEAWRDFVEPGGSVVVVPLPNAGDARALHWQIASGLAFPLADGYFVGPDGSPARNGTYGAPQRATAALLSAVGETGAIPPINEAERLLMINDLRFWCADVVVLPPGPHARQLQATLELLLAKPPEIVDGSWVWDVRDLT